MREHSGQVQGFQEPFSFLVVSLDCREDGGVLVPNVLRVLPVLCWLRVQDPHVQVDQPFFQRVLWGMFLGREDQISYPLDQIVQRFVEEGSQLISVLSPDNHRVLFVCTTPWVIHNVMVINGIGEGDLLLFELQGWEDKAFSEQRVYVLIGVKVSPRLRVGVKYLIELYLQHLVDLFLTLLPELFPHLGVEVQPHVVVLLLSPLLSQSVLLKEVLPNPCARYFPLAVFRIPTRLSYILYLEYLHGGKLLLFSQFVQLFPSRTCFWGYNNGLVVFFHQWGSKGFLQLCKPILYPCIQSLQKPPDILLSELIGLKHFLILLLGEHGWACDSNSEFCLRQQTPIGQEKKVS